MKHGTAPVRPAIEMPASAPPIAGAEDEAEAEGHADHAHAARALLGLGHVGDVRARGAEVRGRDAARGARHEEPGDARREKERRAPRHAMPTAVARTLHTSTGRRPTRSETRPHTGTKRNCISE